MLHRMGFWPTLIMCIGITIISFGVLILIGRRFGLELM
jgi:hypothetical protein